jgi:4-amino-4-deoxy-L-arabinose transferase-like glycosyltransferase
VLFLPGVIALAWREARARSSAAGRAVGGPGVAARTAPGPRPLLFPAVWFSAGLLFLTLSSTKRGAYLLPLYPAAALLVGWLWDRALATRTRTRWIGLPLAALGVAAVGLAGLGLTLPRRVLLGHLDVEREVGTLLPADAWALGALAAAVVAAAVAIGWTWRRGRVAATFGTLVAVQAGVLLTVAVLRAPQYAARYPIRDLAVRVEALVPPGRPIFSTLRQHSLLAAFYVDRGVELYAGAQALVDSRADGRGPRYALVDGDARIFGQPGVEALDERQFGTRRVVLIRVDPLRR